VGDESPGARGGKGGRGGGRHGRRGRAINAGRGLLDAVADGPGSLARAPELTTRPLASWVSPLWTAPLAGSGTRNIDSRLT
jgi:hypothetical protein